MTVTHNFSTLKYLSRGIEHYLYARDHEQADTPAMLLGRAVHTSVLEPDRFPLCYAVWRGGRRQGNEYAKWAAMEKEGGRDILTEPKYDNCLAIRNAVHRDPEAARLLRRMTRFEERIEWTDTVTGLDCSGRVDATDGVTVLELKTTKSVSPRVFIKQYANMLYHGQAAMYQDGLKAVNSWCIAVEQKEPHAVQVFWIPELTIEAGRYLYREWLQTVRTVDTFTGREPLPLELPAWAGQVEDDVDFSDIEGSEE